MDQTNNELITPFIWMTIKYENKPLLKTFYNNFFKEYVQQLISFIKQSRKNIFPMSYFIVLKNIILNKIILIQKTLLIFQILTL